MIARPELLLSSLVILLALCPMLPAALAASSIATFYQEDCTTISSPVAGRTFCFDTTQNRLKVWTGARWAQPQDGDIFVTDFGAKFDGRRVTDGAMTAASANLDSATAAFTAGDVGKIVDVAGAGAAGVHLLTTIATYVSASRVTTTVAASTSVTGAIVLYGSDNAAAINAALTTLESGFRARNVGVRLPQGIGLMSATLSPPNTASGYRFRGAGIGASALYWVGSGTGPMIKLVNAADVLLDGFSLFGHGTNIPSAGIEVYRSTTLNSLDGGSPSHVRFRDLEIRNLYGERLDKGIRWTSDHYTVTGAANNGSGLIRLTTGSAHTFQTGDFAYVSKVGGVPAANGNWTVTRIDSTHVDLQASTFSGTYTSGGVIGSDGNNDLPEYYGVNISGVDSYGLSIESANSLEHRIYGGQIGGTLAAISNGCPHDRCGNVRAFGTSFGVGIHGYLFRVFEPFQRWEIHGGHAEQSGKLLIAPQSTTTFATTMQFLGGAFGIADGTTVSITGAVNNGSGLIRLTTGSAHGLVTNADVTVYGVGGVTAANGQWQVTVVDSTHLDLQGSVFSGAYTSGGTMAQPGVLWAADQGTLSFNDTSVTSPSGTSLRAPTASSSAAVSEIQIRGGSWNASTFEYNQDVLIDGVKAGGVLYGSGWTFSNLGSGRLRIRNGVGGMAEPRAFANGDTSPSVQGWSYYEANYSSPATITALDDGYIGQEVTIYSYSGNITLQNSYASGGIALAGNQNYLIPAYGTITLRKTSAGLGNIWIEVARSRPGNASATASLDYAAWSGGDCQDRTITVTNAADGDVVSVGIPNALASIAGVTWSAWVSSANTVTVRGCKITSGASSDPAAATVRADVWKH